MEPSAGTSFATWMQWLESILNILTGAFVVLGGAIWTVTRWAGRPRFVVGMPPSTSERSIKEIADQDVGHRSIVNQFKHNPRCFAVHLRDRESLKAEDEEKLYADKFRCRSLKLDGHGTVQLNVIVENSGKRAARDYLLGIQILRPDINIVDVFTESLQVGSLFPVRNHSVDNSRLEKQVADKRIVKAYDEYLEIGIQYGDMLFLEGSLEGGMYEMVLLKLKCDRNVEKFVVGYTLDCSDGWISKRAYFQGFKIESGNPKEEKGETTISGSEAK
jgi:hypothetical protein